MLLAVNTSKAVLLVVSFPETPRNVTVSIENSIDQMPPSALCIFVLIGIGAPVSLRRLTVDELHDTTMGLVLYLADIKRLSVYHSMWLKRSEAELVLCNTYLIVER